MEANLLKKRNIICISSIDWDFVWQGHQEIMSVLAENGNRVLFIENTGVRVPTMTDAGRLWKRFLNWKKGYKGIRKLSKNLYVYSPLILPFPYSKIAVRINKFIILSTIKRWMRIMEFHDPIVWSFLPTPIVPNLSAELDPSIFIYYCIDDFASSSKGAAKIKKIEEKVIKMADLVFATSHNLFKRCSAINSRTHLFPFGVSIANYNEVRENSIDMPEELRNIKKPIVGYVGGIHKWVDMKLLESIALSRKDISIVLIGPKQTDLCGIDRFDSVFTLGKKNPQDLPNYVKYFDAGIIPYKITPYTEHVYPTKINEYLAMGKPVISTEIPEVVKFDRENGGNFIYFIKNDRDVKSVIKTVLEEKSVDLRDKRIAVANSNSWMVKITKMCDLIEKKLEELQLRIGQDWLENLKRFYARTRRKTVKAIGIVAVLYLVFLHSPFIWFLASPLKITDKPEKADAIVVFGGGVGEGGSPGKSTIERARYSVDLYNEGFAHNILFSAGYTYKYNDAENMKLFALSMGIPKKNIMLEQKAGSCYENVKYTSQILREKGFDKVLLVTSPYNTRRASLAFGHIAKDIDVIYSPVPDSQFYHRLKPVKLEQIKAIVHEYLGIVYYFFRGYI